MPEGHVAGNLNIIALRRGWSRNFNLQPEVVENIDHATLEKVLELDSLKIRGNRARIYMEHPAESGNFTLIRSWKSDGSLQSILVQGLFAKRMQNGVDVTLDIRDPEPMAPPPVPEKAKAWLKNHTLKGKPTEEEHVEDSSVAASSGPVTPADAPANANTGNGFFGLFKTYNPSSIITPEPSLTPSQNPIDAEADAIKEEEILRQRGWKPVLRRLTTRKRGDKKTLSKFESDIMAEGDGEEIEVPDPIEMSAAALLVPAKQSLFRKSQHMVRTKSKADTKGKGKEELPPLPAEIAAT